MDKLPLRALSNSSLNQMGECEQKFAHYRIYDTPHDKDFEKSTEALDMGTIFHGVLEETSHCWDDKIPDILARMCDELDMMHKFIPLKAMIKRYTDFHEASGHEVISVELPIKDNVTMFLGYVDAITSDKDGYWYIADLKTKSKSFWGDKQKATLLRDTQMNLYTRYVDMIASILEIDPKKFKGCRYLVTTKPTIKQRGSEKDQAYYERLLENIVCEEVFLDKKLLNVDNIVEMFEAGQARYKELHEGEVPRRNYANCISYNSPCPYFSHCHQGTYTESVGLVKTIDETTLKKLEVDI